MAAVTALQMLFNGGCIAHDSSIEIDICTHRSHKERAALHEPVGMVYQTKVI